MTKKLLLIGAVLAVIAVFWALGLHRYLSLDYLKASREQFAALYAAHPFLVVGAYFLIYVTVTALSLPGAVVMTLAGGALFGFWVGTLVISFASTLGATLACFFARFILRDWVQNRFGAKLAAINRGVENEGAFYLFTLRLVPLFPFFVINLLMGLTRLPLLTYYWVSQLGMLPGTMVYVNAGRALGEIESPAGILSPGLLISFAILGLFPLGVKKTLAWYRRRTNRPAVIRKNEDNHG
ncbi:MAG: TVP38/TMEM64 family protein [Deltaproteobacteria bacterium]|nr:TVP38/TMEM64 family protein [Deltaproteobacteria bacterium]